VPPAAAAVAASCGLGSSRSVQWLQRPGQEQSQRQQALARPVAAAKGRCRGCNRSGCSDLWRLLQRPAACVIAASSSLVGASCGSSSTCCTVQRPCRSVPWLQRHLLQPCRSVLWLHQNLLHRPAALHERPVAPAAPVAALQERLVARLNSKSFQYQISERILLGFNTMHPRRGVILGAILASEIVKMACPKMTGRSQEARRRPGTHWGRFWGDFGSILGIFFGPKNN